MIWKGVLGAKIERTKDRGPGGGESQGGFMGLAPSQKGKTRGNPQ